MTILNKVQYFQNKCGCNKTLVYLYQKKKKKKNTQNMTILKTKYNSSKIIVVVQNNYVIAHEVLKTLYVSLYASFLMG